MRIKDQLLLEYENFKERITAFYKKLNEDNFILQVFLNNPIEVVDKYLLMEYGNTLNPQTVRMKIGFFTLFYQIQSFLVGLRIIKKK